jgi:uncharacterized membrane protein
MRRLALWAVFVLSLAVVLHILVMRAIPKVLTSRAVNAIYERYGEERPVNTLGYGTLRRAGTDLVVRDNPDTVTSMAVIDVSRSPVRIHCVVPPGDNYWSASLFAWNTDTFFVMNDLEAPVEEFDLVVADPGSTYDEQENEILVYSPTPRSILIVRMVVTDRTDEEELERLASVQKEMWVRPVDTVIN